MTRHAVDEPEKKTDARTRSRPRIVTALFNSLNGLRWAMRHEAAIRDELAGLALALPAAALIAPSVMSFVAMIGVVIALIVVELLNTAIERLADHLAPYHHPQIGLAKDVGSAAVFVMLVLTGLVWTGVVVTRLSP